MKLLPANAVSAPTTLAFFLSTTASSLLLPSLTVAAMSSTASTRSFKSKYRPVHLYPYTTDLSQLQATGEYDEIKRMHIVRHAEGTHNVDRQYRDIINLDARLTEKGVEQCRILAQRLQQEDEPTPSDNNRLSQILERTDLVVTSPLTRCLQTALLSFPTLTNNPTVSFVAQESIRETVNYACDRRRAISELESHFHDRVDFSYIKHDNDNIWDTSVKRLGSPEDYDKARESAELHVVADRARHFFTWAQQRPEPEMIVCTHSAFLRALLGWGQPEGVLSVMHQMLDQRNPKPARETPVVKYCGEDEDFEAFMRQDYDNCELRSFVAAFPNNDN